MPRTNGLTAKQIESAKPRPERYELSDGGTALRLVIFPSGQKSWAVRYRAGQRTRKFTLGKFPALTLKDARDLTTDALRKVAKGADPGSEKMEERRRVRDTLAALSEQWVKVRLEGNGRRERYVAEVRRTLRVHINPVLGSRDVTTITRRDIMDLMDRGAKRGRLIPNQILSVLRPFFAWCVERGAVDHSPATGIRKPVEVKARDRVLTDAELVSVLRAARRLDAPWGNYIELLTLTAARRTEVAGALWDEFDLKAATWTMPGGRTKNATAHITALAPRALEIVKAQRNLVPKDCPFVFPSATGGNGHLAGFGKMKIKLDPIVFDELKRTTNEPEKLVSPDWHLHDLRRTAATGMARLGYPIHVVERVLNHISGSTTGGLIAVYQRHDYAAERRAALEGWAAFVEGLGI